MNRKLELLKNTIIIGIGNIFTKVLSFLLVPLLTKWLSPTQYGEYDLLYSYVSLIVPLITLQLEQAVLRYTLENYSNGPKYYRTCFIVVLINSVIFSFLFGFVFNFSHHISFVFCTVSYSLQIFISEYVRGCNELKLYSISNIICGLLTMILTVLFVYYLKNGTDGLFIAFGLSYLFTFFFLFFYKRMFVNFRIKDIDFKILKVLLCYSLPLLPNAISWWITNVSDRTLIRIYMGSSFNGIYAVSCKIPTLITVFYGIFNLAWQQSAMLSFSDNFKERKEFYLSTYNRLSDFLFSSAILIISATPLIYKLLLNHQYSEGISIVPILVIATILLNLAQYFGGILLGMKDTKSNGLTTLIASFLNLLINFMFIRQIGLYAAAVSTLFSYIIMFVLRLKKLNQYYNFIRVLKKVIIWLIPMVIFSILSIIVNNSFIQFTVLFVSIVIFIIANRNVIQGLFQKVRV